MKLPVFTSSGTIANSSISDDGNVVQTALPLQVPMLYDRDNTGYFIKPASTSNTNVLRFNNVDCVNGTCPTNTAVRMTPNFHFNSGAGYAVIVNWDNGTTGSNQTFRVGNGNGSDVFYVTADGQTFTTNWWRSLGPTGWYNQTYGGGFFMYDNTWIRQFPEDNSRHMFFYGGFDTANAAGVGCNGALGGGYTFHVCGSMAATSYATLSDERLKKDVHDLDAREMRKALDGLDRIRSVRFRYKDETERLDPQNPFKWQPEPHIGVIAQSVPKELLTPDPTGKGDLSVSLADTLGYTIAAVRGLRSETQETVEHLKSELAERDQQIADLAARLAALEAALKNTGSDR
jgi:hypothetical protein